MIPIILGSASKSRLELLNQIKIYPQKIISSDIDEILKPKEKIHHFAKRISLEKGLAVLEMINNSQDKDIENIKNQDFVIISADTAPEASSKLLRKANNREDIKEMISMLSGRRHKVHTGVAIIKKLQDTGEIIIRQKLASSIVKFRFISKNEIDYYASLDEGIGAAGGYKIAGYAQSFVSFISGS